jgi:acetate---CoA ligase (ADP-forming)
MNVLDALLAPRSVAVVGASRDPSKVGHQVLANLISAGFLGPLHPVHPSAGEVLGLKASPSVSAAPGPIDLAVIAVPAAAVAAVLEDCGSAGVGAAIVLSAGFKEVGPEGAALERHIVEIAARNGIRLLGPNCLGVVSTPARLDASFAPNMPAPGSVAFMSQSGALGTAVLDWTLSEGVGIADFVSLGNKADVSEVDLLQAWNTREDVRVIAAYLESVTDGPGFLRAATETARSTPVVVLKAGGSDAGARAVSSHTGSLAGTEAAYDAAFRATGVVRVAQVETLFDACEAFARQPLPRAGGVAVLTNAGGPAIMAVDALEAAGVPIASLEADTIAALRAALPAAAAVFDPVDILGDAPAARYEAAAKALATDPNVGALIVILTPQAVTEAVATAKAVAAVTREAGLTTLACFMGGPAVAEARDVLRAEGVPCYPFPERAVAAVAAMRDHADARCRPPDPQPEFERDTATAGALISAAAEARRRFVTEESAALIAAAYGIAAPEGGLARTLAEAKRIADRIGYPLVMKVASPDILHKTDIGGIVTGIEDAGDLATAYETVLSNASRRMPDAAPGGVHVQRMVTGGTEIIVGVDRDPTFGPLLMFGMGGIAVEILRDVSFRLCPVGPREAHRMISETRSYALLRGARGKAPADIDAVADVLVRVSQMAIDFPQIVELDINPLIVLDRGDGALAADVRIGIGGW